MVRFLFFAPYLSVTACAIATPHLQGSVRATGQVQKVGTLFTNTYKSMLTQSSARALGVSVYHQGHSVRKPSIAEKCLIVKHKISRLLKTK